MLQTERPLKLGREVIDPTDPIAVILGQNPVRFRRPANLPPSAEEREILSALDRAAEDTLPGGRKRQAEPDC